MVLSLAVTVLALMSSVSMLLTVDLTVDLTLFVMSLMFMGNSTYC